jgi:hypothetical protein
MKKVSTSKVAKVAVTERPLNDWQAKNFLYMLDRMESWRNKRIGEVYGKLSDEHGKKEKPELTVDALVKMLRSSKVTLAKLDSRGKQINLYRNGQQVYKGDTHEYKSGWHIELFIEDIPAMTAYENRAKEINDERGAKILEVREFTAAIRTRIRIGALSNLEAERLVNELQIAWEVPVDVVATANHTNSSCTR